MNKHQIYMDIALSIAKLSKCVSMQVGCIAVNERGRVVSTGINGTVSGHPNCCEIHSDRGPTHSEWSDKFELHAELNCILEMARSTSSFSRLDFYVTHCPCSNCLKHLLGLQAVGSVEIGNIIYNEVYYRSPPELIIEQVAYCRQFGVDLISLNSIISY